MRPIDKTEGDIKGMAFRASPQVDKAIWDETSKAYEGPRGAGAVREHAGILRTIARSNLTRLVVAAGVLLAALALWQAFGAANKAYALSDVPGILRQARTIHVRTLMPEAKGTWEHWYDIKNAREHVYHEGVYQVAFDSPETRKTATQTVRDGQYVMEVDHVERTVRFERWLPSEQELHRLMITDFAVNTALPDVVRYLDRYTKIGKDRINGQSYDIWRREWREAKSNFGIRYDVWVSPATGEIGRTREWRNFEAKTGWLLLSETDRIEINVEPPAGIFATQPPDGYALENSKATAEITSAGFRHFQIARKYTLRVPVSFVLEDGSIVACWYMTGGPAEPDPNDAYRGLTFGGSMPDTPVVLYGLMACPALGTKERYGSVSFWDENTPITIVHGVGRHLMCTRRAGKVYEWALYVPQKELPSHKPMQETFMVIKWHAQHLHGSPTIFSMTDLASLIVTPERLAQYLADAFRELSEDPTVPAHMGYQDLLGLAKQVRENRGLYEDFASQVREDEERMIGGLEPVKVTPPDEGK